LSEGVVYGHSYRLNEFEVPQFDALMGLYETSGDWLYDSGLPGKSGIGGGIVTVAPGKGGLGTFAPLLDSAGNSVKGQLVAAFLSRRLGLDLFAS
jgi:glutaminase